MLIWWRYTAEAADRCVSGVADRQFVSTGRSDAVAPKMSAGEIQTEARGKVKRTPKNRQVLYVQPAHHNHAACAEGRSRCASVHHHIRNNNACAATNDFVNRATDAVVQRRSPDADAAGFSR
jgi:hypothetical protein